MEAGEFRMCIADKSISDVNYIDDINHLLNWVEKEGKLRVKTIGSQNFALVIVNFGVYYISKGRHQLL